MGCNKGKRESCGQMKLKKKEGERGWLRRGKGMLKKKLGERLRRGNGEVKKG